MPKIAASIVFTVCGRPLRNAVVEIDNSGFVLSVSQGGANFSELAGVEYYSGILIPGLVDVLSGTGNNSHSLIASGVRVAGRIVKPGARPGNADTGNTVTGNTVTGTAVTGTAGSAKEYTEDGPADSLVERKSPENQGTEDFAGETWNGRSLGYRIYKDENHFDKLFRESGIEGVFLFDGPGGESMVLAGMGGDGLWGTMRRLHDGNYGFNLQEILMMATLNGAIATGYKYEAGCISEGLNPGLNIIEGIDPSGMKLLPVSRLRRLG